MEHIVIMIKTILKENIDTGYIYVTRWDSFIKYPQGYISIAFDYMNNTSDYKISKSL